MSIAQDADDLKAEIEANYEADDDSTFDVEENESYYVWTDFCCS